MSNYDRKLWERLCKVEEELSPPEAGYRRMVEQLRPVEEIRWQVNTTGIYEQLRETRFEEQNRPAPPIDFAQLQADLYAIARDRARLLADEQAEARRRLMGEFL